MGYITANITKVILLVQHCLIVNVILSNITFWYLLLFVIQPMSSLHTTGSVLFTIIFVVLLFLLFHSDSRFWRSGLNFFARSKKNSQLMYKIWIIIIIIPRMIFIALSSWAESHCESSLGWSIVHTLESSGVFRISQRGEPPTPLPPPPSLIPSLAPYTPPIQGLASPPLPSPPLRSRPPEIQLGGLVERCKLPQWGLGQSPSRNRFWCILALKPGIWWQQF